MPAPKTYDQIKQKYISHGDDPSVMRKLSPSHIIGIKKLEIEERKLNLATDALKMAVLGKLMGGRVVEGSIIDDDVKQITDITERVGPAVGEE